MGTINKQIGQQYSDLEKVQAIAERHELSLDADYSGRGMYGKRCVGVSGDWGQFYQFILDLSWESPEDFGMEEAPRQESMGHGSIWYWPRVSKEDLS